MQIQSKTNLKKAGIFLAVLVSVLIGVFIALRLALLLAPFLIAFALSSLMEPIIRILKKKLKLPRKLTAPIVLLLILIGLGSLLATIIIKLISEIKSIVPILPEMISRLYVQLADLLRTTTASLNWLPPEMTQNIDSLLVDLFSKLVNLANSIAKSALATAISLPQILIFLIISILATYFMASDRDRISKYLKSQLPDTWIQRMVNVKNDMFSALFGYFKAALILMSITFTELFTGFSILHFKYALLLALVVALIDALPILGLGSVLIPWTLYSFFTGDIKLGTSIAILYIVLLIVRQIIEPRVVGYQIGVYPLLTLAAMYTGLQLIGFPGLIIGPFTYLLIKSILSGIYKNKTIKDIVLNSPSSTAPTSNSPKSTTPTPNTPA